MRKLVERRLARVLMLVLLASFVVVGLFGISLIDYGVRDRWYISGVEGFSQTYGCTQYVDEGLTYVANNIGWVEPSELDELGAYSGEAFSYTIHMGEYKLVDTTAENSIQVMDKVCDNDAGSFRLTGYINLPVEPYSGCYREFMIFETLFPVRYLTLGLTVLAFIGAFVLAVYSLLGAVYQGRFNRMPRYLRWPFDVLLVIVAVLWIIIHSLMQEVFFSGMPYHSIQGLYRLPTRFCWFGCIYTLIYVFTVQYSAGNLRKNILCVNVFRKMPVVLIGAGLLLLNAGTILLALIGDHWLLLVPVVLDVAAIPVLLVYYRNSRSVVNGASKLADGDLDYKIKTRFMFFHWRDLGEKLNRIGDGMSAAVEDRMKSERMKTELITNVSHDLKTPLTSVISYVALLKKPDLDEETRREYLDVLERQSAKLKKLTEDVVEASKAASGVITVHMETLDAAELLEQSVGEFAVRLRDAGLEPVVRLPKEAANISADGTLLGRVLENLMTNVLKYAQGGTRVYFDLEIRGDKVCFISKNVSREPLNITAEELMERFVRGDSSRNSEGSGLGLSIARSLTELMEGELDLILDGDLFKAEVIFDRI